jgi:hypothetical protein
MAGFGVTIIRAVGSVTTEIDLHLSKQAQKLIYMSVIINKPKNTAEQPRKPPLLFLRHENLEL